MSFFENEDGVSEVIGIMMIFLIIIVYIGTLQVYEVPSWNKDLERQHFDTVLGDFVNMRSNIEDASAKNIPKTASIEMGLRYPLRYLLQNPGLGASGMLAFEPVNVTMKLDNKIIVMNSTRIIYEMQGISQQPKLVYEHGLIIRDLGGGIVFNDSGQSIVDGSNIFVPIIFSSQQSVSGMLPESFNILPADKSNTIASTMNITLDTKYPALWKNLSLPNATVTGTGDSGKIYINRSIQYASYPITKPGFYSGMVTNVVHEFESLGVHKGGTGTQGFYVNEKNAQNIIDLPASTSINNFTIDEITLTPSISSSDGFTFVITDINDRYFATHVNFKYSSDPNKFSYTVDIPGYSNFCSGNGYVSQGINLTSCYKNATIGYPNSLVMTDWNPPPPQNSHMLYFRFLIY